ESFIQALLSGFQRVVCRLARPSNRWLKRPAPNAERRCPRFKSSTACRALALIRHFGSLKGLARASFQELRQFLPRRQAESVVAALSMSFIAETEYARAEQLDNPESIYRACTDMKLFSQEVLRVILLDTRYRHSSTVEITKGSINESLAHPRDIFRPVIGQSAYAFVLAHNHSSGDASPSEADMRLTRRLAEGARLLQINLLDHVIVGQPFDGRPGYFSFKEAGTI